MSADEIVLVRCIGCDTPLGRLPLTEGAKAHVAACEKHPLRQHAEQLAAALADLLTEEPSAPGHVHTRSVRTNADVALQAWREGPGAGKGGGNG